MTSSALPMELIADEQLDDSDGEQAQPSDEEDGNDEPLEGDLVETNPYENMVDLSADPPDYSPTSWSENHEKLLRSALGGACKRLPNNAEAHFNRGLMHMRMGRADQALKAFDYCRALYKKRIEQYGGNPPQVLLERYATFISHSAQAAHMAARSNMTADERALHLEDLQNDLLGSTQHGVNHPDVWNALGLIHLTEGACEGAKEIFEAVEVSFPDYLDAQNNLALCDLGLGKEQEATLRLQEILLRDKSHIEALCNYGVILMRHDHFEHAVRIFEDATQECGKEGRGVPFAWAGLAVAHAGMGNFEEADAAAKEAEKTANGPERANFSALQTSIFVRKLTTGSPLSIGEFDEGKSPFEVLTHRMRTASRELATPIALVALGNALRLRHEYTSEESGNRSFGAEAAERFVEALEKDGTDAAAWTQLGLLQMGSGEYASARDFNVQACVREDNLVSAWNNLGVTFQLVNNYASAEKAYSKGLSVALDSNPDLPNTETEDSDVDKGGEGAELGALSLLATACIWNNLGNLWRQQGDRFEEAQGAYNKSLLAGGDSAVVFNNLALLYISAGRLEEAEKMVEKALAVDPDFECCISNQLKLTALKEDRRERQREKRTSSTK